MLNDKVINLKMPHRLSCGALSHGTNSADGTRGEEES
jgi:hypothetical protein